jgi:hypothetical protein
MAIDPTVKTLLERRHGVTYLAQLTRKDTYDADTSPFDAMDEDVMQVAIDQAQYRVQLKIGPVAETHPTIVELVPYFLNAPIDEFPREGIKELLDDLKKAPNLPSTGAVNANDTTSNNRRRFTGNDFQDLESTQRSIRGRRSNF